MRRRRFLQLGTAGLIAASLPGAAISVASQSELHRLAEPGLLHILRDRESVRAIGASYRRTVPFEDDVHVLAAQITGDMKRSGGSAANQADIEKQVRRDFDRGRTVQIDGWVLSRTEARQCALFSLIAG
ncbi:MAG: hypothetical protein WD021_06365 [Rhodothermales bacterium]